MKTIKLYDEQAELLIELVRAGWSEKFEAKKDFPYIKSIVLQEEKAFTLLEIIEQQIEDQREEVKA